MHPMVRTANARINGFGSWESYTFGQTAVQPSAVSRHLDKGIDGHDGQVRLRFGVVNKVEIDEFLQF